MSHESLMAFAIGMWIGLLLSWLIRIVRHAAKVSEPDTKGALFKAENILREALADQKVGAGETAPEGHNARNHGLPIGSPVD